MPPHQLMIELSSEIENAPVSCNISEVHVCDFNFILILTGAARVQFRTLNLNSDFLSFVFVYLTCFRLNFEKVTQCQCEEVNEDVLRMYKTVSN